MKKCIIVTKMYININPKTFLLEAINPTIKDALKKRTDDAHDKGIFGAPSFVVNNKIFWGARPFRICY